jgi:Flp pilus assembly pilin Flp
MKTWNLVMRKIWDGIKGFYEEEDGVAVLEIILIIVVLIGLVLIFRNQLTTIINNIFDTISSRSRGF